MSNVKITQLPVAIGLDGSEQMELVQSGVSKRATTSQIAGTLINSVDAAIEFFTSGAGGVLSPGVKGYLSVPFDSTITSASIVADLTGSTSVDIWKCTYADFDAGITHPVVADSITGGNPPMIVASTKVTDETLAGWSTSLARTDILAFYVGATASITRLTLTLNLMRSL